MPKPEGAQEEDCAKHELVVYIYHHREINRLLILFGILPVATLIHAETGKPNREFIVSESNNDTDKEGH